VPRVGFGSILVGAFSGGRLGSVGVKCASGGACAADDRLGSGEMKSASGGACAAGDL
jgi:hypothetical protein